MSRNLNHEETETLREYVSDKLGFPIEEVADHTNLHTDLGMDSLDAIEILFDVEKMFNIHISDDKAENVKTFENLVELINQYVN